jgi:hypothetical protein
MDIENLNSNLFRANGTPTIQVGAYDNNGNELATAQVKNVVSAGANSKQVDLSVVEDKAHVEYYFELMYNITINLTVSSNKWKTGGDVTATAVCTCDADIGVPGFGFNLVGASGDIKSYTPSFPPGGADYGGFKNGSGAQIDWGSGTRWGSTTTFSVTFCLDSKENQHPYIEARCNWWDSGLDFAKIYLR